MKGKGKFFNATKGFGIIDVISEINEDVPDRKRFIDEVLNQTSRKPGLYCNHVRIIFSLVDLMMPIKNKNFWNFKVRFELLGSFYSNKINIFLNSVT